MSGPEELARQKIDAALEQAGWLVQARSEMNIHAARGVAVREFPLARGFGHADYVLCADQQAAGVIHGG